MMAVQIEKNVPLPGSGAGRPSKYPFADMEVGDSFLVAEGPSSGHLGYNARNAAKNFGVRHGMKFSVKQTEGGVRIWRIE